MVDNLLTLARLEGGQTALHIETIRVSQLIESASQPLTDKARARGITVENLVSKDLTCGVDRDTLTMIFMTLFANAAEYTNDSGHVEVAAKQLGKSIELTIANTGCLLSQDEVRHVFERFWRGDASRSDTGIHCGLGLALVRRATASIGGTATASVADGTFTVRLILPATPVA